MFIDLIKDLRKIVNAATPGPWKNDQCGDVWTVKETENESEESKAVGGPLFRMIGTTPTAPNNPNAIFISTFNPAVISLMLYYMEAQHKSNSELISAIMNHSKEIQGLLE